MRIGDIYIYTNFLPEKQHILIEMDKFNLFFDRAGELYEIEIEEFEQDIEDGFFRLIDYNYELALELAGRYRFAQKVLVLSQTLELLADEVVRYPDRIETIRSVLNNFTFPVEESLIEDRWEMCARKPLK